MVGIYDNEEEAFRDVVGKYGLIPVFTKKGHINVCLGEGKIISS